MVRPHWCRSVVKGQGVLFSIRDSLDQSLQALSLVAVSHTIPARLLIEQPQDGDRAINQYNVQRNNISIGNTPQYYLADWQWELDGESFVDDVVFCVL